MGNTSKMCISEWKRDINHRRYEKVVVESSTIAMLFYKQNYQEWIDELEHLNDLLEEMSSRWIMPHVKKYLMDFIELEVKLIKGEITKKKLMKERQKTLDHLAKAFTS